MKPSNHTRPPAWGMRLLDWLCKEELLEEIEGDLYEEFKERVDRLGVRKAKLLYSLQIISFLRPFALKKFSITRIQNPIPMLIHYLKIALRSFWQQKLSSTINVLSLSLGIGCSILIFLFIQNEFSFDTFHENVDQVYRVNRIVKDKDGNFLDGIEAHPLPFAPALKNQIPEIQQFTRIYGTEDYVKHDDFIAEQSYYLVDQRFFDIFTFEFLQGNAKSALADPTGLIITEEMAQKFFGDANPMGEAISVHFRSGYRDFKVNGVIRNPPGNSTLQFDIAIPIEVMTEDNSDDNVLGFGGDDIRESWQISFVRTFVTLPADVNLQALQEKMPDFAAQHFDMDENFQTRYGAGSYYSYQFQPMTDVHFDNVIATDLVAPSQRKYSYILGGIALMVLLIACINFTILAIGRSSRRSKEIGIRKVVGARRGQVANQFLGESMLLSFLGLIFGLMLAYAALPSFSRLANRTFSFTSLLSPEAILFLVGITLISGLIAGFYPALLISAFRPVQSLKNQLKLGSANIFTKVLVSTQFVLSVILVIVTLIMADQLQFLKNKDLGFEDEMLLVIRRNGVDKENFFSIYKNELSNNPRIANISAAAPAFTHGSFISDFKYEGKEIPYNIFFVNDNFLETMGIELAAGRDFDTQIASDTSENIIVNEAFIKELGWKDNPIGKKIMGLDNAGYENPTVIGVAKDFNFKSLEYPVGAMWMVLRPMEELNDLVIRLHPEDVQATVQKLETIWKGIAPNIPFTYSFMDESMASLYLEQERWSSMVRFAGIIAVAIAFFGMFGLVALSVAGRAKEMSIRKVFGASTKDIAIAVSRQFAMLVGIALVIASPVAWYLANEWLATFAYRVSVKPMLFLLAFSMIAIVFVLTLTYHVIQTARKNPADTLRLE